MIQRISSPTIIAPLAIWLAACLLLLGMSWDNIVVLRMWDADDYMRLLQVRDWMAGQSWFDVTQYRLDPPTGFAMHWSRLVDLPLAGLILLLRPLLGSAMAETVAASAIPLVTLGLTILLVYRIGLRLGGHRLAEISAALVACCPLVLFHTLPLRIDHHGWQTMCAIGALHALLRGPAVRNAAIAGLFVVLWLSISLEGLPVAGAMAAWLGLRSIVAPEELPRLRAFLIMLALGLAAIFAATHRWDGWITTAPDAIGPGWIALVATGAASVALIGQHLNHRSLPIRASALVIAGAASLALFAMIAPEAMAGPFGGLDPIARQFWYEKVLEGLPVWRQVPHMQAMLVFFPLTGLAGTFFAFRHAATPEQRHGWAMLLFLATIAIALSMLVQRSGGLAQAFAVPGAGWLMMQAIARAQALPGRLARLGASGLALILLSPPVMTNAGSIFFARITTNTAMQITEAPDARCPSPCAPYRAINQVPSAFILATIDDAPALLVHTHHRFTAGGYHRNPAALARTIKAFLGAPDQARGRIHAMGARYVLIDPHSGEADFYARSAPHGFISALRQGRTPDWLVPVPLPHSRFRLWRVTD